MSIEEAKKICTQDCKFCKLWFANAKRRKVHVVVDTKNWHVIGIADGVPQ